MVDVKPNRDGPAEAEAGDGRSLETDRVHQPGEVGAELVEGAVGVTDGALAVPADVVEDHPVAEGEVGNRLPPEPVVIGQAVDQDQRPAATDLEPGGLDVPG